MVKSFARIEFLVLALFALRLVGITNPPLETNHNWRQATGLMVARNFLEIDANPLYPRVDDSRGASGIIGMEFPTMNWLYFAAAKIFGYAHWYWYGRLLNLLVSSLGLLYFFKLLDQFFERKMALTATWLLGISIWFAFSRKMMPDTFCVSLAFAGLFHASQFLRGRNLLNLVFYTFWMTLAVLTKIPAGIYLAVLPLFVLAEKPGRGQVLALATASLVPLGLAYWWYFVWNPHLAAEFGNWYNSGTSLVKGFGELLEHPNMTAKNFYFNAFHSFLAFGFFLAGLVLAWKQRAWRLLWPFGCLAFVFGVYVLKSGFFFYHHNYYIIPFVPPMALVAAYALSFLEKNWLFGLAIALVSLEAIRNQQPDFFNPENDLYKLRLEAIADQVSAKTDLIVVNGNGNPQQIYLAHRKGWTCDDGQLGDANFLAEVAKKGGKFVFANKHSFAQNLPFARVYDDADFAVYDLRMPENGPK